MRNASIECWVSPKYKAIERIAELDGTLDSQMPTVRFAAACYKTVRGSSLRPDRPPFLGVPASICSRMYSEHDNLRRRASYPLRRWGR